LSTIPNKERPMRRYFPAELLRRLRNDIPMDWLIGYLEWPHKRRDGQFVFVCPRCGESLSDVNPRTNLGRCFHCKTNFNPIEFAMSTRESDFVETVNFLTPLLPKRKSTNPT
jgi:DNA primase